MRFNSIRFEISVLYTAILGLILIVFSGILYGISNAFLQHDDEQLKVKALAVNSTFKSYLDVLGKDQGAFLEAAGKTMAMRNENFLQYKTWKISQQWNKRIQELNLDQDYINFVSQNPRMVYSSPNVSKGLRNLFLENVKIPSLVQVGFWTLKTGNKNIRVINESFINPGFDGYLIQVGVPQEPFLEQLRNWLSSIIISVPLVLLLTNFVGRVLANRILKPVYEITNLAKRITQEDLSARITTKHFDREMGNLIESFNEMIARLEKSFKHIEQFSYHVAHELKTPLTIIQGEANLMLRRDRSVQEYKQALQIITEESQRMLKTVDDLLLLTKLDYRQEIFKFEEFDFVEFFNEIVEQNRLLAANKGIGIRSYFKNETPLMVNADRLHLRRLFFNIIDNAIKFTPEGGCIDTRVERDDGKIIGFVSDTGPGIAPENLEKIFENFNRADNDLSSSGLGLNIAYTIAKIHQGDIEVESQVQHGTTFRVILPLLN